MTVITYNKPELVNDNVIICTCGAEVRTVAALDFSFDSFTDISQGNIIEREDIATCPNCKVEMKASISKKMVFVDVNSFVEVLGSETVDNSCDGSVYNWLQLEEASIGDEVGFEDGTYRKTPYEYRITEGILTEKYSNVTDNDQLSFAH